MRGFDRNGTPLQPDKLFAPQSNPGITDLDSLTHHLHLANARKRLPIDCWLFLNVAPSTFIQAGYEQTLAAIVSKRDWIPAAACSRFSSPKVWMRRSLRWLRGDIAVAVS